MQLLNFIREGTREQEAGYKHPGIKKPAPGGLSIIHPGPALISVYPEMLSAVFGMVGYAYE